ncbi:MAG: hypothetical protein ACN6I0_00295 [Peredibacter sp.]
MTETNDKPLLAKTPVIPVVKETSLKVREENWTLKYYPEFENIITDYKEDLIRQLAPFCHDDFSSFRVQLIVGGIPLLFGLYIKEKTIGVYSPRLGRELFLIEQIQQNKNEEPCATLVHTEEYKTFKDYAERVAALPLHEFPSQYDLVTKKYDLPDLINDRFYQELETDIDGKIQKLVKHIDTYKPSFFEKVSDFGLDLTARFALMRIHLLKFLAILPSLDHDESGQEVKRILLETFRRLVSDSTKAKLLRKKCQEAPLPGYIIVALKIGSFVGNALPAKTLADIVRNSVRFMAKRFIAGENIESVQASFSNLFQSQRDVTLDQLGELVVSEKEADNYCREVLNLIEGFGLHVKKGDKNKAGINRAHVSIKVSALCSDFKPEAPEYTYSLVAPRLKEISHQG